MAEQGDTVLAEADLPSTAARGRFTSKVAIVTGGASGKLFLTSMLATNDT